MKKDQVKKRPLSDTVIANLEPETTEYSIKDSKGLYLFVKPTGARSWKMRYKDGNGKWRWHGLGSYPATSGAMARKLVQDNLLKLQQGANTLTAKPTTQNPTFEQIARQWYAEPVIQKLDDSTKTKYLGVLEKHIFPTFGKKEIALISRQVWLEFFKKLQQKTNPKTNKPIVETANRALQVCGRIYRFALQHDIAGVTFNPLDHLQERLEKYQSEPYKHLGVEKMPQLLKDIDTIPSPITKIGVLLLAHLFLRPNEVLNGQWAEIDFDNALWHIPASRMKKRKAHTVPLSRQVLALLNELRQYTSHEPFLFPSNAKDRRNALARYRQALKRMGYDDKQTLHGFRHIASTTLNNHTDENGNKFDERVIETALAHSVQGVKGVYNKAEYLDDRKKLMQWYSDFLENLAQAGRCEH